MIIIFRHIGKGAETEHTLCKSPRCIGMPCFDPTEYTVSKQQKPFGNLLQDKAFNWNLDYWYCRGFWNREVLHVPVGSENLCPYTYEDFSNYLMQERLESGWMFRIL